MERSSWRVDGGCAMLEMTRSGPPVGSGLNGHATCGRMKGTGDGEVRPEATGDRDLNVMREAASPSVRVRSGDRTIIMWSPNGTKGRTLTGHSDAVRAVKEVPGLGMKVLRLGTNVLPVRSEEDIHITSVADISAPQASAPIAPRF